MPFANPDDRNAYMREYRRRPRIAQRSHDRTLEPEFRNEPSAIVAPVSFSSSSCGYCFGTGRSSAGTLCSYCSPPLKAVRSVRSPHTVVQVANLSPSGVWIVVAGVIGAIGVLLWLWRRSSSNARSVQSSPCRDWVHWMEGVKL